MHIMAKKRYIWKNAYEKSLMLEEKKASVKEAPRYNGHTYLKMYVSGVCGLAVPKL